MIKAKSEFSEVNNVNVTVNKKELIALRRQKVLELLSRGLSQQNIAHVLQCSQPTISNDIEWLKKDADNYIRQNRGNLVLEYRKVMSNFEQVRREAWSHFSKTEDEKVKVAIYDVLQKVNDCILSTLSIGDMLEAELLKGQEEQAKQLKEEINKVVKTTTTAATTTEEIHNNASETIF